MKNISICKLLLSAFLFLVPLCVMAQERSVSGLVSGSDGEGIIGASVKVKGTKLGTITDFDGKFTLSMPQSNSVLVISYIGHDTQEVETAGKSTVNVVLIEKSEMLNEMVVIGYGSQRRLNVTGSVGTVQSKDLVRASTSTVGSALAGKVPGITFRQTNGQPGETMRLEVRNMGNPLFIIDGVMKDQGQFNNLDINDIENISILKDGSAAIYGVKAANGVVLVTTKRGKLNEKPTVSVNAYYGIQNWTRFPKFSNAYDYMRARADAEMNTNGTTSITQDELDKWAKGGIDPATGADYNSFDWYDFAINGNAPQKYLNVSSNGGSEKTTYYLSISRVVQESTFPDFEFNRSNFQLNLDTRINKFLKVGATMNGRLENRLSPTIGDSYNNDYWRMRWGLNQNKPTERPYANDNPNYINATYNNLTNQAYGRRGIAGERDNLYRVFQGNWDVEWTTPIDGLKMSMLYSYYYANEQEEAAKNQVFFYKYDKASDSYYIPVTEGNNPVPASTGSAALRKRQHTIWENMYRFSINYEKSFGNHSLSGVFVTEATERFDKNLYLINDAITDDFQNFFPKDNENNKIDTDSYSETPTAGFIGRVNYNYLDKYLLELSGRYDGSYLFPKGKRWGFFPSVSIGWRVSEENFFKNNGISSWMDNMKLRLSYGEMGDENVGINPFSFLSGYTYQTNSSVISQDPFSSNTGTTVANLTMNGLPITNLTWIHVKMHNIGVDMGFLNNKLSIEVDGFYRKRTGLPTTRADITLPTETGNKLPSENMNTDMHMGFDGFLKWNDRVGNVQYYAGVNATFARKKDGKSYGQKFANSWDEYRTSTHNRWAYVNWGYEVIGRFQTQEQIDDYPIIMEVANGSDRNMKVLPGDFIYKDQNNDGIINDMDSRPIGYAENGLPYVTYGISLGANWNNFDIAVDFSGAAMQSFQQNWETKWPFQASGNTFEFMVNNSWHRADPLDPSSPWIAGDYPALRLTPTDSWNVYCNNSEYWLTNVRYLRLKNLEIGYTLPKDLLQKLYIQSCRFYFNGTNLFSLDNLRKIGLDPENTDTNGLGYPGNRVLTLGVNLTF